MRRAFAAIIAHMGPKGIGAALRYAGQPIVKSARNNLSAQGSVETGALRRSLGMVLRSQGKRDPYLIIGARRGGSFTSVGPDGRRRVPANYAHLVEFGHITVNPTKGASRRKGTAVEVGRVKARPFLAPAFQRNRLYVRLRLLDFLKDRQLAAVRRARRVTARNSSAGRLRRISTVQRRLAA